MLYVVTHTTNGYAREDADVTRVIGVYYDPEVARIVALATGNGVVTPITLNEVSAGHASFAKMLGHKFPEYIKISKG